jgi:hypothetical protein
MKKQHNETTIMQKTKERSKRGKKKSESERR